MNRDSQRPRGAGRHQAGLLALTLMVSGVAGCSRAPEAAVSSPVAARVGDELILVREVEEELASRLERGTMVPAPPLLLEEMIERNLLVQKALEEGLDRDPDVRRGWEKLLISRYKERHHHGAMRDIAVTEEEIQERYETHGGRFSRSARAQLAILSSELSPTAAPEQREEQMRKMREAREKALESQEGPGFGAWAVDYGEDQATRNRGGDAGWLEEGVTYRWPEEIVRAGFALKVGEVTEVLTTATGIYLVRKLDERGATQIPLEQVRDQIRKEIRTEKIRDAESAFARSLRENIAIETYPEALAEIAPPDPARAAAAVEEEEFPPAIP
ncbi:MAG TPA: peptidyl-prolyl cis-trans isomerase [Verrucomicrobiales bacterium]|nr:peptidyl-prolyl cis-trans isomerase [Verrucomicrobiales bacterium]